MYQFSVPIFKAELFITNSREEYIKERSKRTDEYLSLEDSDGCCSDFGGVILVGVFDGQQSTLVHELNHTTFKILNRVGIKLDQSTTEVFSYLQEYLFKELNAQVCELWS